MKQDMELYDRLIRRISKPYRLLYWGCVLLSAIGLFVIFSSIGVVLREIVQIVSGEGASISLKTILLYIGG